MPRYRAALASLAALAATLAACLTFAAPAAAAPGHHTGYGPAVTATPSPSPAPSSSSPAAPSRTPSQLPATGSSPWPATHAAVVLLAAGLLALGAARLRFTRRRAEKWKLPS
jgi:hypothetical protein